MKKISLLIPFALFCSVFLCALAYGFTASSQIDIFVKGVDHDILKEGIRPAQFGELSIGLKDEDKQIKAFQITLARGNRAVDISDVRGNTFDLKKYSSKARAGDRIVIEVKTTARQGDSISPSASIVVLVVK